MNVREKEILKKSLDVLKKIIHPKKIVLFGSRAKGKNKISSDFDLAVESGLVQDVVKAKVKDEIEKICGLYNVDVVYLNEVDEKFKNIILKTGKVIYG